MNDQLTEQLRGSLRIAEPQVEQKAPAYSEEVVEWWGDIGRLTVALAKAQAEFLPVRKSSQNPFFKRSDGSGGAYADLAEVIDATRPALTKHGLAVVQLPSTGMGSVTVTTLLLHESGAGIRSSLTLPSQKGEKLDVQTIGSAMTYARRFSYQAVVHVAGEEDDDGNQAASPTRTKEEQKKFAEEKILRMKREAKAADKTEPKPEPKPKPVSPDSSTFVITPEQRQRLWAIGKAHKWEEARLRNLLGSYGFEHTSEVTIAKYDDIIAEIEGRKAT